MLEDRVQSRITHPLVVEMSNLLAENEVFQKSGTSLASFQGVLVFDRATDVTREIDISVIDDELLQKFMGRLLSVSFLQCLLLNIIRG
jgi:hypothetical protein